MTTKIFKQLKSNSYLLLIFLSVLPACNKDIDEHQNPYNGKSKVEFNPDLTYGSVVDLEGNKYKTIKIGTQTWMAENLRSTVFRDSSLIIEVPPYEAYSMTWDKQTEPAWCANYGSNERIATFGRLYNWYAATDPRNIAPEGWHVSTKSDWKTLIDYLIENGYNTDGSKSRAPNKVAKSLACSNLWYEDQNVHELALGSTSFPEIRNVSGFSAAPSGIRVGVFDGFYESCYWWCGDSDELGNSYEFWLYFSYSSLGPAGRSKYDGLSIRCVKDN